ncbi:hypothetical protein CR513_10107, partial [Mucuna pruriens]
MKREAKDYLCISNEESNVRSSLYLSDLVMRYWKVVKHTIHFLKRIKGYVLTYQKSEELEIIEYFDSNFARCQGSRHFMPGYVYMLAEGAIS